MARVTEAAIEARELAKRYGSTLALAGLTMTVRRGEVFGFLGPNGAGKTTAVKLLAGLTRPTGGSGTLLGAPLGDVATRARVGYLPELFRYQPWMTAREVLLLHGELARLPAATRPRLADEALGVVGLADRGDGRVGTFSKGMQQRLGLGVALLGQPELVLLDEPTSALDPLGRLDVRRLIDALRSRGVTVFLNSHLLTEVERVCDRVAIVDRGRVLLEVGMAELLAGRTVSIRAGGLDGLDLATLGDFGRLERTAPDELTAGELDDARIPDLVAALVGLGARIHAVVPAQVSLEERFLDVLGGPHEPPREPPREPPTEPPRERPEATSGERQGTDARPAGPAPEDRPAGEAPEDRP
jgi:ABC-2 type transport system ATP-binding protein